MLYNPTVNQLLRLIELCVNALILRSLQIELKLVELLHFCQCVENNFIELTFILFSEVSDNLLLIFKLGVRIKVLLGFGLDEVDDDLTMNSL